MATNPEQLGGTIVADINALVAKTLLDKYLSDFIHWRDRLLQEARPDDPETVVILRAGSLSNMQTTWDVVLQTVRSELPKTLDQLLSDLKPKFQGTRRPPSPYDGLPTLPPPVVTEAPGVPQTTKAPTKIHLLPSSSSTQEGERLNTVTEPVASFADTAEDLYRNRKRALDPTESTAGPSKLKAKRTRQTHPGAPRHKELSKGKTIKPHELMDGEYIFGYDGYSGDYVLRCSQNQCRKLLYQEGPTTFNSDPFKDGLALEHFGGRPHNMHSEPEIFHKFALRVVAEETSGNSRKKDDPTPDDSLFVGDDPAPQQTSPEKPKDKGKKPERPYSPYQPTAAVALASNSVPAPEADRASIDSLYRVDSPSDDDNYELPPLEDAVRQAPKRTPNI
ncbi:hypothetical protein O1611_g1066 [Lasiodiplodia mahajangana]|uniref:Uncharacterized protein n=1 Tax=Lasiodiplodia mahajangana TaxID=1108764 RepID=A0ACC2JYL5_9PEZI|nr:hypothetical protein O1611_g1066 [Lasiodiplodia mahajangana]